MGLIPLERSAFHFEIRKRQAQRLAAIMLSSRGTERSGTRATSELWLQTKDGKVGGKVDRIIIRKDGATIIDFKSGSVTDVQGDNPTEIKPEYKDQLMLYAALYYSTNGSPPTELQVVGLDGETHSILFTMDECEGILADAIARLGAVNEIISSPDSEGLKKRKLASPSALTCLYCEFRPGCDPYLELTHDPGWQSLEPRPIDVIGELKEIRTLGNGRLWAKVTTAIGIEASIRGLDPKRHSELLQSPHSVTIFSLSKDSSPNSFIANQMTTVFTS
jgi:hypothetical protein